MAIVVKSKSGGAREFKNSLEGQEFLLHLLECLFALPNCYGNKNLPKCKSIPSRIACYDLIVEMVKGSFTNYALLHSRLVALIRHDYMHVRFSGRGYLRGCFKCN